MDGYLPPVDVGGWLDFQRRRAQQLAQERIKAASVPIGAAAGVAGDWIGQANRRIEGLLPTWAQPEEPPSPSPSLNASPEMGPPTPPASSLAVRGAVGDVQSALGGWGDAARQRIDTIGAGLAGDANAVIDAAQGIVPAAQQLGAAFTERLAQPDAQWNPLDRERGLPSALTAAGQPLQDFERAQPAPAMGGRYGMMQRAGAGAIGGLGRWAEQMGGRADTLAEQIPDELGGYREGAWDAPGAAQTLGDTALNATGFAGAAMHGAASGAGMPEPAANAYGLVGDIGAPNTLADDVVGAVVGLLASRGVRVAAPVIKRVVDAVGAPRMLQAMQRGADAVLDTIGAWADQAGAPELARIVNEKTFDPTGYDPVKGRLASQGKPGRAPGPAMYGPLTAEEAAKVKGGKFGALGPPQAAEPFPPGPGPKGEYTIPHPTGADMVAPPPAPNTYLSSDGIKFWTRVVNGETPYRADYERTLREFEQPRYPWDIHNEPPPLPGEPGYGRLPGLEEKPLAAPDWDARLAGWAPRHGTDPTTLRHLLNRYATQERFPKEAVDDLAPSHPDLATPEARAAAEADLNEALNKARARRSKNEDRAIASERNVRKEKGAAGEEGAEGGEPSAAEGNYSYTSKKGITPDGVKGGEFHLTSSYEVASAIKFDRDPNVVSYQKGAGPRGRVRIVIDPKYGYNPNSPALMKNSDPGPGSEVIYSPDWLVTFRDGSQKVVETKNAGIVDIPAWRIEAKTEGGQRHFEDQWGVGFMMMAEDQLGRAFLRELADTAPDAKGEIASYLRRIRPGDLADLQKKLRSAANASRGGADEPRLRAAVQHLADLNSSSRYPASADLDDTLNLQQYMSAARAQAEWHNSTPADGTTFSVDGENIPLAPGLGGYMVGVTPVNALKSIYPTHRLDPYRLAQFRHENADLFELLPGARVGTYKGMDKGEPVTFLDIAIKAPDAQSAAEAANLFRQRMVYNIDRSTNVPIENPAKQWLGKNEFTPKGALDELQRIIAAGEQRVAAGGKPGGEFVQYRSRGGQPAELLGLPRAAPRPRAPRAGAARGRGAVSGVLGADEGAAQGARTLGDAGGSEPLPGGGLPSAAAPGLPADGRGSGIVGFPGGAGAPGQSVLGDARSAARAAIEQLAPRYAARTGGQRAADLALGAGSGAYGFATADEDARIEERLKRGASFAALGAGLGPAGRGLAGESYRALRGQAGDLAELGVRGGRGRGRAPAGPPAGRVTLGDIPTILGSVPLMAPSSLGANFTGGMARTLERVLGQAFELRPFDAITDLASMVKAVPGAGRRFGESVRRGPTAAAQGAMGAPVKGDLSTRGGALPTILTGGVRVNAATDQFWRDLNEAGAGAVARRRGLSGGEAKRFATRAGDFATFTGSNSVVASKLTEMKRALHDPNANLGDKAAAWFVTSTAPYIMMPERLLRATVLAAPESAAGFVGALKRGDKAAAREAAGRLGVSLGTLGVLYGMYENGQLTGDPPQDANERRRREAQGTEWNTITLPNGAKLPTRSFGSVGMQASMVASVMDAAKRAEAKGADPGAVMEARVNELAGWALDNSYLSDLGDFVAAVGDRRFADAGRQILAGVPNRVTGPVTGAINAADPYEREPGTFPEMVEARTGLRSQVPTRIDPTTGEDQVRRGSGWDRYWGTRGSEQTAEAIELSRLGLQPSVLGRTEEYEGAKQTPEQRRVAQRALGSETGRAVRAAMASPTYKSAKDEDRKKLLQAALREASRLADVKAGEQVARSPQQQAQRAWDAIPKYQGVDGTPDEIRRQNAAIAAAKAAQAAAKKRGDAAFDQWERDNPRLADLALTKPENPKYLTADKEDIEAKYGVQLP